MYSSQQGFDHEQQPAVGVLLVNLGTPDAPTTSALRRYLKQFLSDPRVVEMNRALWWLLLNGIILNTRPKKSAHAYQSVWGKDGSPLMKYSKLQTQKLQMVLSDSKTKTIHVELAMTYGSPSIQQAMQTLREKKCDKIMVLPLYPQYSGSTTAAVTDQVFEELQSWRRVPDLRVLAAYHDLPSYIDALANSVREHWQKHGQAEKLLMSFHGIPQRYFDQGDPYPCHCRKTGRLLAERLGLNENQWLLTFQSIFGREEWVKPYTAEQLKSWGSEGIKDVDVICPGFASDCLETLEEIQVENHDYFIEAGGQKLSYIPALNDRDDHIEVLAELVKRECSSWL